MSRARTNKENRPKRPSTLGLLLGGTGGRKDASKGAEAERQRRRRERDRSREMAAYVGYDAMYRDGIAFYLSENGVWLTKYVDPRYITYEKNPE